MILNKYTENEYDILDDEQESKNEKNVIEETKKLLDKYYVTKICCRTNLMTFYNTIKYIK
jgi:DNA-directed RNA polymerase subunit N (RpoN/RPB10)